MMIRRHVVSIEEDACRKKQICDQKSLVNKKKCHLVVLQQDRVWPQAWVDPLTSCTRWNASRLFDADLYIYVTDINDMHIEVSTYCQVTSIDAGYFKQIYKFIK